MIGFMPKRPILSWPSLGFAQPLIPWFGMDEFSIVPATRTDSSGTRRGWIVERLAEMKRLLALKGG